jgi:hypothetical protein
LRPLTGFSIAAVIVSINSLKPVHQTAKVRIRCSGTLSLR